MSPSGRVYVETSQFDKAVEHFEALTKAFPNIADIEFLLGNSLWSHNKEKAFTHFKRSAELGYSNVQSFYNFAVELDRQRDFEAAILCYEIALSIDPNDPESLANLAADLAEVGKLEAGLEHAQKACAISPNDLINLNTLGGIYAHLGELKKAKEIFKRIIEMAGDKDSELVQNAKHVIQQISSYENST